MAYDNDMKGTLGKNKRKEKDSHPDHTGSCEIDGVQYWISAWIKENGSTGEKFFSLAFKPKEDRMEQSARDKVNRSKPGFDNIDDEIPF